LIFLPFAVALTKLTPFTAENDARNAVPTFSPIELCQLSRCTQFPEYVLEGHDAARKSRNPRCVLYLNPGIELRQGNGIGSFWHSNPNPFSLNFVRGLSTGFRGFSATTMHSIPGKELKTKARDSGN
jgi:hypothetical protein